MIMITANMVECQRLSRDIIQSTYAKVASKTYTTIPGPLRVRALRVGAASGVMSCCSDHLRRHPVIPIHTAIKRTARMI